MGIQEASDAHPQQMQISKHDRFYLPQQTFLNSNGQYPACNTWQPHLHLLIGLWLQKQMTEDTADPHVQAAK